MQWNGQVTLRLDAYIILYGGGNGNTFSTSFFLHKKYKCTILDFRAVSKTINIKVWK